MRPVILALLALAGASYGALSACDLPVDDINDSLPPKVVYVDQNDEAGLTCENETRDTLNIYVPGNGALSAPLLYSNLNLRLAVDYDANATGNYFWLSHNSADTLFRVRDDSTWRAFGAGSVTKLTSSDSIVAAILRVAGAGIFSGTLGAAGVASIGTAPPPNTNVALDVRSPSLSGTNQYGIVGQTSFASTASDGARTLDLSFVKASAYAQNNGWALHIAAPSNAGSTTNIYGIQIENQSGGTNNWALKTGTGKVELGDSLVGINARLTGNIAAAKISASDSVVGAHLKTVAGNLIVGGSGNITGTLTADSLISAKFYTEDTFTATLDGVTTVVTGTARYVRIGKVVTLFLPALTGTSNTTSMEISGIPSAIRPARDMFIPGVWSQDNGSSTGGAFSYATAAPGLFSVHRLADLGGGQHAYTGTFTNSGTKGLTYSQVITYTLQ